MKKTRGKTKPKQKETKNSQEGNIFKRNEKNNQDKNIYKSVRGKKIERKTGRKIMDSKRSTL